MIEPRAARRALLAASLFAGAASAQEVPASAGLLAADSAMVATSTRSGLRSAIEGSIADDALLLYAGAPVVRGRPAIATLLAAQPLLDSIIVRWLPMHLELSADGAFGVVYGVTLTSHRGAAAEPDRGWYVSAWRKGSDGAWKLAASLHSGVVPSASVVIPTALATMAFPPFTPDAKQKPFADADLAFAALAHRENARAAFERYASPQGALADGDGLLAIGPAQIGLALAGSGSSDWVWAPVAAGSSTTGDLGFTVGEATIRSRTDPNKVRYSKYLTVWRRGTDGAVRFVFDAGNGRPARK